VVWLALKTKNEYDRLRKGSCDDSRVSGDVSVKRSGHPRDAPQSPFRERLCGHVDRVPRRLRRLLRRDG